MKLILLKNVKYSYEVVVEANDDGGAPSPYIDDDYAVMSEAIDVEFPKLSSKKIIDGQVAVIDKQIKKVMADSEASITALKGRKQELLAITCDSNKETK